MVNGTPEQHRRRSAEAPSITTASTSHQQDMNARMAKYAMAMGIRTVCFVLIFLLPWPWKWFAAAGAILLPYVAVLIANAGRERQATGTGPRGRAGDVTSPHRERAEAPPEQLAAVQVVRGETVDTPEGRRGHVPPPPGRTPDSGGHPVYRASGAPAARGRRGHLPDTSQQPGRRTGFHRGVPGCDHGVMALELHEPSSDLLCSARGCRSGAAHALRWNNPRLHTADRRKTWLACDEHREHLSAHLQVRGFLREVEAVVAAPLASAQRTA